MIKKIIILIGVLSMTACLNIRPTPVNTPAPTDTPTLTVTADSTDAPTDVPPTSGPTATPEPVGIPAEGKDPTINPLTGETYTEAHASVVLERRPLLVKVSAYPPSQVMPHRGLQQADHVWEHVVEGFALTRYTAVYLGESPELVGSVRSGRPPDLELVPMYQGLYVASGYSSNHAAPDTPPRMTQLMQAADWRPRNYTVQFGYGRPLNVRTTDQIAPHNLFTVPELVWYQAGQDGHNQRVNLDGFAFTWDPPRGGTTTNQLVVDYPGIGAYVQWDWNEERKVWLRTISGDGTQSRFPHTDYDTGEQLAFKNVVIVYADHSRSNFIEDENSGLLAVNVDLFGEGRAVIFRNGLRYDARWIREGSESENMIRFVDEAGDPLPFDPGRTWFQVVSTFSNDTNPEVFFDGVQQ